jgi:CARDB
MLVGLAARKLSPVSVVLLSMGKRALLGVLALACISAPAAGAASTPAPTRLTSPVCHRALLPADRRIALTSVMRPVSGTTGMEVMFDLQRARRRSGPFMSVRGGGLGRWIHPENPTLGQRPGDIWNLQQKVEDLSGPAYYRFRVRFRWLGSTGRPLRTTSAAGPNCYEPELRPDLLVRSLAVHPVPGTAQPGSGQSSTAGSTEDRYVATLVNRGLTGAGAFELELILPGGSPQTLTVSGLGSRSSTRETFTAPACTAGSRLTVIADPSGEVPDYNRTDNTLTTTCPASTQ